MFPEFIAGPAGPLQLQIDQPSGEARAVGVLCHPHPLHGGTLTNKVIHQAAKTFVELGAVAVRFNFRGAGKSGGTFDEGEGEVKDLETIADWARERWPGLPLWLGGFSFGAYVSLRVAARLGAEFTLSLAPPVNLYPLDRFDPPRADWLVVQGTRDEIVPADAVRRWIEELPQRPRFVLLEDSGHFFHGRLNQLREEILAFAAAR